MEKHLEASVRKVVNFLTEHNYRYAIIGGIAFSQWGIARATVDADFKVLVPDQDYAAVRTALHNAFPQAARIHAPRNPLIVAAEVEGVVVDFLLAVPGYDEMIVERAVQRDFGGWTAWVCTPEDLIIQKAIADRDKDWTDIRTVLIVRCNQLDHAYVEDWLRQFVEALDDTELLDRYRSLLEQVRTLYASTRGGESS